MDQVSVSEVSTPTPEEIQIIAETFCSDADRLLKVILFGSSVILVLDLVFYVVYIRRMIHKRFALLIFTLVLMAMTSFIAGSAYAISSVNSYEQLTVEQQIEVWASGAHNKYSDMTYNCFQLILFGDVCICASYFLFILQYWQLSLRLEAACKISKYSWKTVKIWQHLLFFVPLTIYAGANCWWIYDDFHSKIFKYKKS